MSAEDTRGRPERTAHPSRPTRNIAVVQAVLDNAPAGPWVHRALCRDEADPELFFPIGTSGPAERQIEQAKAICRRCKVAPECLDHAVRTGGFLVVGIWGGTTEDEREALFRRSKNSEGKADDTVSAPTVAAPVSSKDRDLRIVDQVTVLMSDSHLPLYEAAGKLGISRGVIRAAFEREGAVLPGTDQKTSTLPPGIRQRKKGEDLGRPPEEKSQSSSARRGLYGGAPPQRPRERPPVDDVEVPLDQMKAAVPAPDSENGLRLDPDETIQTRAISAPTAEHVEPQRQIPEPVVEVFSGTEAATASDDEVSGGTLEDYVLDQLNTGLMPKEIAEGLKKIPGYEDITYRDVKEMQAGLVDKGRVTQGYMAPALSKPVVGRERPTRTQRPRREVARREPVLAPPAPPEPEVIREPAVRRPETEVVVTTVLKDKTPPAELTTEAADQTPARAAASPSTERVPDDGSSLPKVDITVVVDGPTVYHFQDEVLKWMRARRDRLREQVEAEDFSRYSYTDLLHIAVERKIKELGISMGELADRMGLSSDQLYIAKKGRARFSHRDWKRIKPVLIGSSTHPAVLAFKDMIDVPLEKLLAYPLGEKLAYLLWREGETQSSLAEKIASKGKWSKTRTVRTAINHIVNGRAPEPTQWRAIYAELVEIGLDESDPLALSMQRDAVALREKELQRRADVVAEKKKQRQEAPPDPALLVAREKAAALCREFEAKETAVPTTTLGQEIKALREEAGMTRRQLAVSAGRSSAAIAQTETGKHVPTRKGVMESIIVALGFALDSKQGQALLDKAQQERAPKVSTYQSEKERERILAYLQRYGSTRVAALPPLFGEKLSERQIRGRLDMMRREGTVWSDHSTSTWHLVEKN